MLDVVGDVKDEQDEDEDEDLDPDEFVIPTVTPPC